MERVSRRKTLVGKVVSNSSQKTITISVDSYIKHPIYGKRFKQTRKFAAHDEQEKAKLGDIVQISETRPYSKTKKFRLEKIIQSGKEGE